MTTPTMATEIQTPHMFLEEKIVIEPDLGDQRRSNYKALPAPPKTPRRVMMKYRFSGVFPLVLSLVAFVLTLVVVLAGRDVGVLEGQYLVVINASHVGQNIITFERATTTQAAPAATSSTTPSPLDALNPFSTNSPLNPANPANPLNGLGDMLGDLSGNLTDAVNDGLGDVVNGVVEGVVSQMGVKDFYYVYLQQICSGELAVPDESNADGAKVGECSSWEDAKQSMSNLGRSVSSSLVVGQTQVSVPLIAKMLSSFDDTLDKLDAARKAAFAFLVISMVGSMLSVLTALPAMYFPQSRLLIYFSMFWSGLAVTFAFSAALLLSVVSALVDLVNDFSGAIGMPMRKGSMVLLLLWLSAVFLGLVTLYWSSVWFVETRKSSFVKRQRDEDEMGHWRGIGREVWRDVKGRRKRLIIRSDI
ncbi:hypothetical protein C7974DRAFT_131122 [Boeremia exigua]|uniref:uncharacterized protein n=1 Tax=Boeremia exigua TaxID=749465 RepID=UPI001E8E6B82|nr:uncharacterized protein C7974DRAFT_131122 [Boeremia exigua]KAH6639426.1 hypothetical protein C7974DRAFT_131122 [Boeremia exigua]